MAIHPSLKGLTVQVIVDDEPLTEYPSPPEQDPPKPLTIRNYIQGQPGKKFAVRYDIGRTFPYNIKGVTMSGWVFVDGQYISSNLSNFKAKRTWRHVVSQKKTKGRGRALVLQDLCFDKVVMGEFAASTSLTFGARG